MTPVSIHTYILQYLQVHTIRKDLQQICLYINTYNIFISKLKFNWYFLRNTVYHCSFTLHVVFILFRQQVDHFSASLSCSAYLTVFTFLNSLIRCTVLSNKITNNNKAFMVRPYIETFVKCCVGDWNMLHDSIQHPRKYDSNLSLSFSLPFPSLSLILLYFTL